MDWSMGRSRGEQREVRRTDDEVPQRGKMLAYGSEGKDKYREKIINYRKATAKGQTETETLSHV